MAWLTTTTHQSIGAGLRESEIPLIAASFADAIRGILEAENAEVGSMHITFSVPIHRSHMKNSRELHFVLHATNLSRFFQALANELSMTEAPGDDSSDSSDFVRRVPEMRPYDGEQLELRLNRR